MSETEITETKAQLKAEIEKLKGELEAERKQSQAKIGKAEAAKEVVIAALAAGVPPEFELLKDLTGRIEAAGWTMRDGRAVMVGADNLTNSAMGPNEWIHGLKVTAKHFFNQPGSNAQTGGNGGGGKSVPTGRANPWSREGWDDMAQAAAYRQDPDEAEALAKAAGSRIGALRPA